jgi:RNA polymerase sigma-70 factor (ECF subfamily)
MWSDDDDILKAALAAPEGDFRAFEQLVQLYRKRIRAGCLHLTRDANNADDLTQEVFVKAFFALRDFEGRSSFRHWLFRINVNHCLNHLSTQQRRETISLGDESEEIALRRAPSAPRRTR